LNAAIWHGVMMKAFAIKNDKPLLWFLKKFGNYVERKAGF
jgi:hypothetical protein